MTALVLSAALGGQAWTQAPAPQKAPTQVDEVTVTAKPKDPAVIAHDYVRAVTALSPIDRVARWRYPICPGVVGLQRPAAEAILLRVREVAKQAGAPMDDRQPCQANLHIVFTAGPQDLLNYVAKKRPDALGYHWKAQREALKTMSRPVQAWYITSTRDNDGFHYLDTTTRNEPIVMATRGGLIADGIGSVFEAVTVVVDTSKIMGMEVAPLADHIAMLGLAQIKASDKCSPTASIRDLFLTQCEAQRTKALSDADAAYLHALYHMKDGRLGDFQQSVIQAGIRRDLGAKVP